MKKKSKTEQRPRQHQDRQPGIEAAMRPMPNPERLEYRGSDKLKGKIALITGGDSGIGRAIAIVFAKEGADLALSYLNEDRDANDTRKRVEEIGRRCLLLPGDLALEKECHRIVAQAFQSYEKVHVLVNNAAEQHPQDSLEKLPSEQLERTFRTNIFSCFHVTQAVLPRMGPGDTIVNTTSVTAYRGSSHLIDYSATKGAIVAFTRSLSQVAGETWNSRQWRGSRPRLDAFDSFDFSGTGDSRVRFGCPHGACRSAGGNRAFLCFSGLRRLVVHDGPGAAS